MRLVYYFIAAIVIIGSLNSCTVPVHVYLRNLTDEPKKIQMLFSEKSKTKLNFYYINKVEVPKFRLFEGFLNKIRGEYGNDSLSLIVKIPPNSTMLLEKTLNFRSLIFKEVNVGNIDIVNDDGTYERTFKHNKKGLSKYSIWYDITE